MNSKRKFKIITLFIPLIVILVLSLKEYILAIVPFIPACSIYSAYDIYCPACGNTRSVVALLHGDILTSIRFNIVPVLLLLLTLLGYLELASYSFGKHLRLLPRKLYFYLILIAILIIYWVGRNSSSFLTP